MERYRSILEPCSSPEEQEALHRDDEETTWFGVGRDRSEEPVFEDFGRFADLVAEGHLEDVGSRYPQLVSFIGQTGKLIGPLNTSRRLANVP